MKQKTFVLEHTFVDEMFVVVVVAVVAVVVVAYNYFVASLQDFVDIVALCQLKKNELCFFFGS